MGEGLNLLLLGMGGVFMFLLILVVLMNISAKFFTTYSHLFPEEAEAAPAPRKAAVAGSADEEIAVAIAAMKAHVK